MVCRLVVVVLLAVVLAGAPAAAVAQEATPVPAQGAVVAAAYGAAGPGGLPGACFAVYARADADLAAPLVGRCAGAGGTAALRGIPDGEYVLVQTTAPAGYWPAVTPQPFAMVSGQAYRMGVQNTPRAAPSTPAAGDPAAASSFVAVDEGGAPLPGVCLEVAEAARAGAGAVVARVCDGDDGRDDGRVAIGGLPAGEYVLAEVSAPAGYAPVPLQAVVVGPSISVEVAVAHRPLPPGPGGAGVEVGVVAEFGDLLPGACFALIGSDGAEVAAACDGGAGDAARVPGQVRIDPVPPGTYVVHETAPPAGYAPAADAAVAVADGEIAFADAIHIAAQASPPAA